MNETRRKLGFVMRGIASQSPGCRERAAGARPLRSRCPSIVVASATSKTARCASRRSAARWAALPVSRPEVARERANVGAAAARDARVHAIVGVARRASTREPTTRTGARSSGFAATRRGVRARAVDLLGGIRSAEFDRCRR